jgi:hypothetical protein
MASTLQTLVSALDDDPWCGTRPPHWPPRPHKLLSEELVTSIEAVTLNPQPLPPRSSLASTVALQQVRLFQTGRAIERLGGAAADAGAQLMSFSSSVFDDYCGTVPLSVLIQWLLHHNPPPPPPWLDEITQIAAQLTVASKMEGASGAAMQQACLSLLKDRIKGLQQTQQSVRM